MRSAGPSAVVLLLLAAHFASAGHDDAPLVVPVRIHLVADLAMRKDGRALPSWVTPLDVERDVLPEVNRIWSAAGVRFVADEVREYRGRRPPDAARLIARIVDARRDGHGKASRDRIAAFDRLLDYAGERPDAVNVHLVPYLGATSQGHTRRRDRRILVAEWSDKPSRGLLPPERVALTEPPPFRRGSLARTLAHELGHVLGLRHPDEASQRSFGLLMGGRKKGERLTTDEIATARRHARAFEP